MLTRSRGVDADYAAPTPTALAYEEHSQQSGVRVEALPPLHCLFAAEVECPTPSSKP